MPFYEIALFIEGQSQSEEFDTLYYIDPEGNGYSLDGDYHNFAGNEAFKRALNNEFVVTEPHVSFEADEMVFDFAVPVIAEGELVAVLYSQAYLSDFLKSVELSTEGTGDVFIVNHELNLVFSTSENHVDTSFIPDGDVSEMGMENVCITIRKWIDDGLGQFTVSVNCSRLNLENPFFVEGVVAIADKYNVPHDSIEIELIESTTITNESTVEKLFFDLRQNGFKISIDDFGAGYSSLGVLKNLHVDTLKMDRSFFIGGKNARRDDMLIDSR